MTRMRRTVLASLGMRQRVLAKVTVSLFPLSVVCSLTCSMSVSVRFCSSLCTVISRITRGSSVYIQQGLCLTENTSSSARHASHFAAPDTVHENSFLTFSDQAIFNNIGADPRSTATSAWHFCGTTTTCRL